MKRVILILMCFLFAISTTEAQVGPTVKNVVKKVWVFVSGKNPATPTQAAYYFSTSGSDSNDGLSEATPFASLSKLSTLDLSGSVNKVLFKKGDVWEGSITIAQSGTTSKKIIFDSYGTGVNPIIYGSDEITDWTVHSGSIYKATYVNTINQLFVDGERLVAAREPETGFFTVDAAPTTSQITSAQLNGAVNHTGASCIIHSSSYGLETKAVTSSSSTTITLASTPFGNVNVGEKFIVVGKLEYLDSPGEWYYDSNTDVVYVWLPNSGNPASYTIRGSITDYGLTASSKSNFEIKNIQFKHQRVNGINLSSCSHYTVSNVTVADVDDTGIADLSCDKGTYSNNTIVGANHRGILSELSDSMLIQSNNVSEIALFENLGLTGIGPWYGGSGIATNGNDNNILSNIITYVGYNGISFNKRNTVKYNYINTYCLTKNDGGGIYTSMNVTAPGYVYGEEENKNSVVQWNTILNGMGVTTNAVANANAIYLDESSGGIIVKNNNIGNCTGWGIFWHKGNHHITRDNILYACKTGMINTPDGDDSEFVGNYIYAKSGQLIGQQVNSSPVVTTLDWDSNHYVAHYGSYNFNVDWTGSKNWSYWRTTTGFDAHTTYDTMALATNYKENFLVNSSSVPVTFYRNNATNVKDAFTGEDIGATVTLQAYSSKIITGLNPDCYLNYSDSEAPVITAFTIPETGTFTIPISSFTATGAVTKYLLNESAATPTLTDVGWSSAVPTSYTFASSGSKTLYAWVRDAAGNISSSASDNITVSVDLKQGLIAVYEFEDAGTTLVDSYTNGLNGTNKNASNVDYSATPVAGNPGNAYSYSGATFRYSIINDNALLDFTGAFTIAVCVNPTTLSSARGVFGKRDATYSELEMYINANGSVSFTLVENGNNTNRITCTSPTGVIVAATDNLIELRSYGTDRKAGFTLSVNKVNQTLTYTYSGTVSSDLNLGIANTTAPFSIGTALQYAANMTGKISQLAIWNYATPSGVSDVIYGDGNFKSYTNW